MSVVPTTSAAETPVESTEAEETPTPAGKIVFPKKSVRTPMEVGQQESKDEATENARDVSGLSRSFKDEMLPTETAPAVQPKTKSYARWRDGGRIRCIGRNPAVSLKRI